MNTGAVALNDQELRNCIYRGEYNDLLKELARNEDYRKNLSLDQVEKRMKDVEYVLRFASFYHIAFNQYKSPMKKFMNIDMETHRRISSAEKEKLRDAFKQANSLVRSVFGDNAFKKFKLGDNGKDGAWEQNVINSSLYDVIMYGFAVTDKEVVMKYADVIRDALINLIVSDAEFVESIEKSTSSTQAVITRFTKWMFVLREATNYKTADARTYSQQVKKTLFEKDNTCALCNNTIHTLDDAAVDHIEQYHLGGTTTPDNARLTHRYCNWARSRKDQ